MLGRVLPSVLRLRLKWTRQMPYCSLAGWPIPKSGTKLLAALGLSELTEDAQCPATSFSSHGCYLMIKILQARWGQVGPRDTSFFAPFPPSVHLAFLTSAPFPPIYCTPCFPSQRPPLIRLPLCWLPRPATSILSPKASAVLPAHWASSLWLLQP